MMTYREDSKGFVCEYKNRSISNWFDIEDELIKVFANKKEYDEQPPHILSLRARDTHHCLSFVNMIKLIQAAILIHPSFEQQYVEQHHLFTMDRKVWTDLDAPDCASLAIQHHIRNHPVSILHILAIIAYADMSPFCTIFRPSYRQINVKTMEKELINSHQKLYHFSPCLFESVEFFGRKIKPQQQIYHGLDRKLHFEEFSAYFHQPTSTTIDVSTATRFCDESGIILTFKSATRYSDDIQKIPKYLSVSRGSTYCEAERLFSGMHSVFQIDDIYHELYTALLQKFGCLLDDPRRKRLVTLIQQQQSIESGVEGAAYFAVTRHSQNIPSSDIINIDQDGRNQHGSYLALAYANNDPPDETKCKTLTKCMALNRICRILKLYDAYITDKVAAAGRENGDEFVYDEEINYVDDVNLLNDFNHLLQDHSHEFEEIYNYLNEKIYKNHACDLTKCLLLRRNQRDRMKVSLNPNNIKDLYFTNHNNIVVSQQLLDRIHCYYLHSFDIGYKIKRKEKQNILNGNTENTDNIDNDSILSEICKLNRTKSDSYRHISGLERLQSANGKICSVTINDYKYGFLFYYWKYYRFNTEKYDIENGNYRKMDLYVGPKYDNLKQELINNRICTISKTLWDNEHIKATKHIKTKYFRSFKCARTQSAKKYELEFGWTISLNHIMAMIIYCGLSELQFEFKKTFRRKSDEETIEEIRDRHCNFHHFARLLREIVECYGMKRSNESIRVYHGANKRFTFQSLDAFIKGPFSTSTEFCVAVNFAANEGIVLELNIDTKSWILDANDGVAALQRLNCFDCVNLSDFPNEHEIFCIGGLKKLQIINITDKELNRHYLKYIKAIKQMTSGMSDEFDLNIPKTKKEQQMVYNLLSHQYHKYLPNHKYAHNFKSLPSYIDKLLDLHCKHIKTIHFVEKERKEMIHQILTSFFKMNNDWIKLDEIIAIFPNIRHIQYYAHNKDISFIETVFRCLLSFLKHKEREINCSRLSILIDPLSEPQIMGIMNKYQLDFNRINCNIHYISGKIIIDAIEARNTPPNSIHAKESSQLQMQSANADTMKEMKASEFIPNPPTYDYAGVISNCQFRLRKCLRMEDPNGDKFGDKFVGKIGPNLLDINDNNLCQHNASSKNYLQSVYANKHLYTRYVFIVTTCLL